MEQILSTHTQTSKFKNEKIVTNNPELTLPPDLTNIPKVTKNPDWANFMKISTSNQKLDQKRDREKRAKMACLIWQNSQK